MLKVGLFGVGHLGRIHLNILLELKDIFKVVGFFDPNDENASKIESELDIKRFNSEIELIEMSDCIDIVTPTKYHFLIANNAIGSKKHVFIEKPIAQTTKEAEEIKNLASIHNVKVQVGHVERFNPAFIAAKKQLSNPMFIETHRLAQFNPRGTDVPVVLDLMIHDLDIILSVVDSQIKNISASGVSVVSDSHDITNARIEFENGCVANLTASRISLKNMRKSRFFQKDAYVSVDFLNKEYECLKMESLTSEADPFDLIFDPGNGKPKKKVLIDKPEIEHNNAIKEELISFYNCIKNDTTPIVSEKDGLEALKVAYKIQEKLLN